MRALRPHAQLLTLRSRSNIQINRGRKQRGIISFPLRPCYSIPFRLFFVPLRSPRPLRERIIKPVCTSGPVKFPMENGEILRSSTCTGAGCESLKILEGNYSQLIYNTVRIFALSKPIIAVWKLLYASVVQ